MARYIHDTYLENVFPEEALTKARAMHARKHIVRERLIEEGEPVPPAKNITHAHMQLPHGVYAVRADGEVVCVAALCNRKGIRDALKHSFRVV